MSVEKGSHLNFLGGCSDCKDEWYGDNYDIVKKAKRHCDKTGHITWVDKVECMQFTKVKK